MGIGKKIILMSLALLFLSVGAMAVYASTVFHDSLTAINKTYKKLDEEAVEDTSIQATDPITILLMGVDTDEARGGGWEGRSDTMILLTVNPQTQKTTMVSLTRDLMVEIANADGESTGTIEKLNHSYSYGQAPMTVATIEKLLDVDINYYVQINMDGLSELVDAVGGITVNNTLGFPISIAEQEPAYTATIDSGEQLINGEQALVYARMRYDDPEGDYGRQKRQREVIQQIVTKLLTLDGVTQYQDILNAIAENMQTDIAVTTDTLPSLLAYKDSLQTIESYQLTGDGQMIDEVSYQIPTAAHLLEIQNVIKSSLGLETTTTLTTNARVYESLFGVASDIPIVDAYTGVEMGYSSYSTGAGYTTDYTGETDYGYSDEGYADYVGEYPQ